VVLLVFPNTKQVSILLCLVVSVFHQNENAQHSRHVVRKLLGKTFKFLCIEKDHFFQWVLSHILPNSCVNDGDIWLQLCGCGRKSHLQIPDPKISWKINMDIKLTLPI
jgi:hypothetical protein